VVEDLVFGRAQDLSEVDTDIKKEIEKQPKDYSDE